MTGRSKGAMISQRAAATHGLRLAQWLGLTEQDGWVGYLPLFRCGGDETLYAIFTVGGICATLPKADIETMFQLIEAHRLTWIALVPGVATEFLHHPNRERYDLTSLRIAGMYRHRTALSAGHSAASRSAPTAANPPETTSNASGSRALWART
jgi:fatty-acyl-CoA synthase